MTKLHTLLSGGAVGYNLLNNGAFTQHQKRVRVMANTSTVRSEIALDLVEEPLYRHTSYDFDLSEETPIGFWVFSGVSGRGIVAPIRSDGSTITSRDGGNVLLVSFAEDGDIFLDQVISDPKRLYGAPTSFAMSGLRIDGAATVTLSVLVNGEDNILTSVSSLALGDYRRFGGTFTFPEVVDSATVRIKLTGCVGDTVGLAGIVALLGGTEGTTHFVSSFVDRSLPSGVVLMVDGESCPPGYFQYEDGYMALVSGTKAFQQVNHEIVFSVGHDTHDHVPGTSAMEEPSDEYVETRRPLDFSGTRLVRSAPFGVYPPTVPFTPYTGELPETVLGLNHSHSVRTRMRSDPPTFPIKFCKKL